MKKFREINRLKEDSMDSSTLEAPAGNQFRQGDSPAARSMIEKPQKEPMKKLKQEDIEKVNEMLKPKMSALDKFRQASSERTKKHDDIEKQMQVRHAAGKEDMSGAIDRLSKQLNREELEHIDEGQNKQVEGGDPCWKNYQMVGKKMKNGKEVPNCVPVKEETDTLEKSEMAQTQLHFIKYAAEEILEYIDMGGEIEEWYQNKLSKVQSEVESLHSYIEGESRRTGMKEESEQLEETPREGATPKFSGMYNPAPKGTFAYDQAQKKSAYAKARAAGSSTKNARARAAGEKNTHMFESEEQMSEGVMKSIATDREETARLGSWKSETPWMKSKGTVTDKSGAKHSPMSRARDLARVALNKKAKSLSPVKEEKEDSRKAEIVKDVIKKAKKKKSETTGTDKFEANPVLSSEIQKQ